MTLTDKEIYELELECEQAREKCKEFWKTIQKLKSITEYYTTIYNKWYDRYERADRKIAMEKRRKVYPLKAKKEKKQSLTDILSNLSKEQILAMAQEIAEEEGDE